MKSQVVVIGGGPGGYVAALRAAQLGAEVTLVEREELGGVCLHWGCIPTKTLMASSDLLDMIGRAAEFGIDLDGSAQANMAKMMARKQKVIQTQVKGIQALLHKQQVNVVYGRAAIQPDQRVAVTSREGESRTVAWDKLILAVGSDILEIPTLPFDGRRIISSNQALQLQTVPQRLLIVGGGVIGCEFATLFAKLGSKVTLVEGLERLLPLPAVDAECSKLLQREMKKRKIDVRLHQTALWAEPGSQGIEVGLGPSPWAPQSSQARNPESSLQADQVLVCVGRRPNTRDLGLEHLGVQCDAKGWITGDAKMQAGANVYAVGDVLGPERVMLAHVASYEGLVAAENAMGGERSMDYAQVPGAIFTSPEVACVGLSQAQAEERGIGIKTATVLFRPLGKAQAQGELAGQAKLIVDASNDRLLGVHLAGSHVTELIAEGTLALNLGCRVQDLAQTIHPHPTLSEIMFEAANALSGHGVHS